MCDFEGDVSAGGVAVVAVSLKMWDILDGDAVASDFDGDVASETRDGDSVSSSSAAEAAAVTTETWSSAPAASSDAGAGAETAETEPADDRDDRVARGWARAGALLAARRRAGPCFVADGGHLDRVELLDDAEVALPLDLEGRGRGRLETTERSSARGA